jgi:hypothetical protein
MGINMCLIIEGRDNHLIRSIEEWKTYGSTQRSEQWADNRSAKELAKAFLRSGSTELPKEIRGVLDTHEHTREVHITGGIAEVETPLDDFRGKGRFHDIILVGQNSQTSVLVGVDLTATGSLHT